VQRGGFTAVRIGERGLELDGQQREQEIDALQRAVGVVGEQYRQRQQLATCRIHRQVPELCGPGPHDDPDERQRGETDEHHGPRLWGVLGVRQALHLVALRARSHAASWPCYLAGS
jgi:hypothetical protein